MLRGLLRKFAAVTALLALLLPGVAALVGTIAADSPVCCNTNYCPLHHSGGSNSQKSNPDCPGKNMPGQTSSTIRACDPAPNPMMGTALLVLVAPAALRAPVTMESAVVFPFVSAASFVSIPLTPPPRAVRS